MPKMIYKAVAFALGALGFGSCDGLFPAPEYGPMVEYGVPTATYILSGQVVKATDQTPLEGIEIKFQSALDTTDSTGEFGFEEILPPCGPPCSLKVADIDGTENGELFENKSIGIIPVQTDPGDGDWDLGTWQKTDIDIELDEQSGK